MLTDYFEDFILLKRTESSDSLGGRAYRWSDSMTFQGGVTQVMAKESPLGDTPGRRVVPVLVHEWDVTLRQGDVIRRKADSAVYRVAGHSGDMRTPALAGLRYCQVPVERLVSLP